MTKYYLWNQSVKNKKAQIIMTKISLLDIVSNDFLFERTRDKPKIKRIFIILEPIIAPIAISVSFLFKALIVTNNSGSDVPNPMIKIPVIKAGTFSLFDKATDPKTNLSPPIAKSKIPIGKSKAWVNISLFNNQKNNSLLIKCVKNYKNSKKKQKNLENLQNMSVF